MTDSVTTKMLKEQVTITHSYFGNISDIVVGKNGKIYVGDQGLHRIEIFSKSGDLIDTLGRKGKGPGEFEWIADLQVKDDTLFVYDSNMFRLSLYSIKNNFQLINVVMLNNTTPQRLWVSSDMGFIGEYIPYYSSKNLHNNHDITVKMISRYENSSVKEKPLFSLASRQMLVHQSSPTTFSIVAIPFGSRPIIRRTGWKIYYGETNQPAIKICFLRKDSSATIPLHITSMPIPQKTMDSVLSTSYSRAQAVLMRSSSFKLPEDYPLYNNFVIDEHHHIWISTNELRDNDRKWIIVDSKGRLLNTVWLDKSQDIRIIKDSYAYCIQTDSKGFTSVAVYHID